MSETKTRVEHPEFTCGTNDFGIRTVLMPFTS